MAEPRTYIVEFDVQKNNAGLPSGHHSIEVTAVSRQAAIDKVHELCRANHNCHAFHCRALLRKDGHR